MGHLVQQPEASTTTAATCHQWSSKQRSTPPNRTTRPWLESKADHIHRTSGFKIDVTEVVVLCRQPLDDVVEWFEHWRVSGFEAAADESLTLLLHMEHLDRMSGSERRRLNTSVPLAAGSPDPRWYGQDPGASKGLD